jgi:hypothetical protein
MAPFIAGEIASFTVHRTNPLDDPAPRFSEFIQHPSTMPFERWQDMRVDVSNDVEKILFDGINVEAYYCTWRILLAAEVADAGVHIRINLADETMSQAAFEALRAGRLPEDSSHSFILNRSTRRVDLRGLVRHREHQARKDLKTQGGEIELQQFATACK